MKIGILTYYGAHNYGAFLQAYAMQKFVSDLLGHDVKIINYRTLYEIETYNYKNYPYTKIKNILKLLKRFNYNKLNFDVFEKSILNYQNLSSEKLYSNSIDEFRGFINSNYDLIIVGSDEIWKVDGFRKFPNAYWLPGVICKKIAYAVSSRNSITKLTDEQKVLIKNYINDFEYIGTRDKSSYELISELLHEKEKCYMNCDPTFLYDFNSDIDNGKKILKDKFKIDLSKKIIGLILSDERYGLEVSRRLNKDYEIVSLSSYIEGVKNHGGLTPFEWIDVISACDMIITSRFHGMIFSIKANRPFLSIEIDCTTRSESKMYDFLDRNGLTQYYVDRNMPSSELFNSCIPQFLNRAKKVNYFVNYEPINKSEKQLSESFINKLRKIAV